MAVIPEETTGGDEMSVHSTELETRSAQALAQIPAQRCPQLGQLPCQRSDVHARGHVYHGAWAPDRHDLQD